MFNIIESEFGNLRAREENGTRWFVAKDICDMIGYKNVTDVFKEVDPKELAKDKMPGGFNLTIVTSKGLNQFFVANKHSRKENFKSVREWAFESNLVQTHEGNKEGIAKLSTLGECLLMMSLVNIKLLRLMVNHSFQLWR
ncbi:BRO family protein [Bacillus sp. UNC437CL72CviS29]|uniref:BRO family protein n=1 Tax=Bacillus sp. UNC437CL72CviS29 TaxID=1340430 RepID=UPI00047DBCBA|nr:BRO family protein [Bacillus sp. UNC437CL72CviS29]